VPRRHQLQSLGALCLPTSSRPPPFRFGIHPCRCIRPHPNSFLLRFQSLQAGGITEEMCARISKDDSCSMGGSGRILWPRILASPAKELDDRVGLRLSCVEAALWVEERWQTATGAAGATACSFDAAGDNHKDQHICGTCLS
jgi:hypothetical protein